MALGFHGSTHLIWGLPHVSRPLLTRVKSQGNSSPDIGAIEPSRRETSTRMASLAAEETGSADADPYFITVATWDALAASSPICPTSDTIACAINGSSRVAYSCGIAVTPGCDVSITGISTPTCVGTVVTGWATSITSVADTCSVCTARAADGSICAAIAVGITIMAGCLTTIADASHVLSSCYPPTDAVVAIHDTCPIGVVAPADSRHAKV